FLTEFRGRCFLFRPSIYRPAPTYLAACAENAHRLERMAATPAQQQLLFHRHSICCSSRVARLRPDRSEQSRSTSSRHNECVHLAIISLTLVRQKDAQGKGLCVHLPESPTASGRT